MLMLSLDDAVKVAMNYINGYCDNYEADDQDELLLRQNMEQKCWISDLNDNDPVKNIHDLIQDINPSEICDHIRHNNLNVWCEYIQVETQLNLMKMPRGG